MNKDPRQIIARFDSKCAETGKAIKKGEPCIYYPIGKKVFCLDSKQADEISGSLDRATISSASVYSFPFHSNLQAISLTFY